jgi:ribonuclease-3 family protein
MEFQTDDFLNEIQNSFGTSKYDAYLYSSLVQAYIGDAVYELVIRTILVDYQNEKVKNLHKKASSIVKAESQAKLIRSILSELSEEEMSIFRRGKNAKSATMAKNASAYDYHYATGFEAVIGYLYLNHNMSRALKLIQSGLDKMECYQEFDKKD